MAGAAEGASPAAANAWEGMNRDNNADTIKLIIHNSNSCKFRLRA